MSRLSTETVNLCTQLGLGLLILYSIVLTGRAIYQVWPQNDEVQFVWQKALTDAARYLDTSGDPGPVAVGGWSPGTMDPPTISLSLRRRDLVLSYFDPRGSLLIPAGSEGSIRIFHPTILELDQLFVSKLVAWGASVQQMDSFTLYSLAAAPELRPQFPADILFGGELRFFGLDRLAGQEGKLELVTYWQAIGKAGAPRRLFLHLLDQNGTLLAEDYAFDESGSRPQGRWQIGDLLLRHHQLPMEPILTPDSSKSFTLRLGIYDPNSCPPLPCLNLPTPDGTEYLELSLTSR